MQLTMREQEKMMISLAAMIAQRRKDKGIKLNHPEAVALITDYVLEGAREGKTVAQLMDEARNLLTREDVMEGIAEMIPMIQVEATLRTVQNWLLFMILFSKEKCNDSR